MAVLDALDTLAPVREKVEAGERLDARDGLTLMRAHDLTALGELAERARRLRGGGEEASFVQSLHLERTNVCSAACAFCAFARAPEQEGAYTLGVEELVEAALARHERSPFTEIRCVNGHSPHVGLDFYVEALRALKEALPDIHLSFYTASEIHHAARREGCTHEEALRALRDAGLGSLAGGGAEVFADRARRLIAPQKESAEEWLDVHGTAHRLGVPTHCSLLYGHVETAEERVDHLLRLRSQQDETGGFLAFVPLAFQPANTALGRQGLAPATGADDLRAVAVSRLLLDNVTHVQAHRIAIGSSLAQVALHYGANDLLGTGVRDRVLEAAGAGGEPEQTVPELVRAIREAGRIPVQRDTLGNELRRWEDGS